MASITSIAPYTAEELVFPANLRAFGSRAANVCSLGTSGKFESSQTFERLVGRWASPERSRRPLVAGGGNDQRPAGQGAAS